MTIVWSPRAIGHLAHLRAHTAHEDPNAASRVGAGVLGVIERLADFPNLGRPGRVPGTRELLIPGTRYIVQYRVRGERLEIIAVFHERQRWPKRL